METSAIETSLKRLSGWVEKHDNKGYEPFDGLSSFLAPLTFNILLAQRFLQQAVLRSPFHIRPLIGVRPEHSTKAMGFFAKGYIKLYQASKDPACKERAEWYLDWLVNNMTKGYSGACWGNHFHYVSRGGTIKKHEPTEVWSGLIGQVFMDAYEAFGDPGYLSVARSVCDFIIRDLPRTEFDNAFCISYVVPDRLLIHNANMLGCALLGRVYKHTQEDLLLEVATKGIRFTCSHQLDNGAWYYGVGPQYKWVDNWHTAYNLDSLKCYNESTGNDEFSDHLVKGYDFYKQNFFFPDGKPKYFYNRLRFVDIQCCSQSIDTLSNFSGIDADALDMAWRTAMWTIEHMQDETGYFYFRDLGWRKVRVPMLHWGQATMFSGLSHLVYKLSI